MRVTESSLLARLLDSLTTAKRDSARALEQLADGKKVRRGSDDPLGAATAIRLRGRLVQSEGYKRTGATLRFDLATVDTALTGAFTLIAEARSKAVAAGSPNGDPAALALEVNGIRAQLLALANTVQGGRYLFAGTETVAPPFDAAGTYSGNGEEPLVAVDTETTLPGALDGERAFAGAGNVFTTLDGLVAALGAGDSAAIQAATVALTAQLDNLNAVRSDVGSRLRLLDETRVRLEDEQVRLQQRISDIEDVELDLAAVQLVQAESSVTAITTATARALQRSLFDFLG